MTPKKPAPIKSSAAWIRDAVMDGDKVWAFFWLSSKLADSGMRHHIVNDRMDVTLRAGSCIVRLDCERSPVFYLKTRNGEIKFPLTDAGADRLSSTIQKETLWQGHCQQGLT